MARYLVTIEDQEFDVELDEQSGGYTVNVNGRTVEATSHRLGEGRSLLLVDGHANEVDVRSNGYDNGRIVFMKGVEIGAQIDDYRLAQVKKLAGFKSGGTIHKDLKAPMPGLILEVRVKEGDKIPKGEPLLIVEAMKMENIIKAPSDVEIRKVIATAGSSVEKGDSLMEFE
jgi:acetyl/propionyl-CoA carboxylase alpha subunit